MYHNRSVLCVYNNLFIYLGQYCLSYNIYVFRSVLHIFYVIYVGIQVSGTCHVTCMYLDLKYKVYHDENLLL